MVSPNPTKALEHLGKLLGLFPASGGIDWKWFADPKSSVLESLLDNRDELADIIAALVEGAKRESTLELKPGLHWEPFPPIPGVTGLGLGLVWTADTNKDLHIGVAAKVTKAPVALNVVVWLFALSKTTNPEFRHLLGNGEISGTLECTDTFLSSIVASLAVAPEESDPVKGSLTVTAPDATEITLDTGPPPAVLPWDLARMGTFIIGAWLRWKALDPSADPIFKRLAYHLFPMFGGPGAPGALANPIDPLPLFTKMKQSVVESDLLLWPQSLVQPDGTSFDTDGVQRFLWHGRALLTGDESASFFDGSLLVQIDPAVPGIVDGIPPVFADPVKVQPGPDRQFLVARWDGPDLPADKKVQIFHRQMYANNTQPKDTFLIELDDGWKPRMLVDLQGLGNPPLPIATTLDFQSSPPSFSFDVGPISGLPVPFKVGVAGNEPIFVVDGIALDSSAGFIGAAVGLLDKLLGEKVGPWLAAVRKILDNEVVEGLQMLLGGALQKANVPDPILLVDEPLGEMGSIEVTLSLPASAPPKFGVEVHLKLGEMFKATGIHVGDVGFGFALALPLDGKPPKFEDVKLELGDIRLDPDQGIGALVKQFLPKLTELEGFVLALVGGLPQPPFFRLEGGGRIPIEQKLGPLDVRSLLVAIGKQTLALTVDVGFDLSGIIIAPYELGVEIDFQSGDVKPRLDGLGLSMDLSGLTLGGMFAKYLPPPTPQVPEPEHDYLGGLQISVFDLFQLAAIGGYSQVAVKPGSTEKEPSLFIFANLDAPLGGPPYFFVTGISGGFGYNRRLPPVFPLSENPFLKVMRGEIPLGGDMRGTLTKLGEQFAVTPGGFWVAAGLEFTSCGFINGTLGAAIGVNPFQLQLFGAAGFGIANLAYFELEFGTVVDTEKVLTIAGLTHNSYLIHPDLFGLRGQFGLGVWHSGANAGDFVLSIGGYHPLYTKPDHYPEIERIEMRASLFGFLNLSVSCFFTCTPRELMAGAAVSLWGEFAGIDAGLDVYVDVLIKWDPFKLLARMGVCVWFEFLGRHEISVDLEIHTPPFGGSATIDLALVSFTIEFGDDDDVDARVPLDDFAERQLRLTPGGTSKDVTVPSLAAGTTPGLFRIDVGWGRTAEKAESHERDAQEGLDANQPIPVQVEFGLVVKSRLPLMNAKRAAGAIVKYTGDLHLPLSALLDCTNVVTITVKKENGQVVTATSDRAVERNFPAAQYSGEEVEAAQMNGRAAMMAKSADAERVVLGAGDYTIEFDAEPQPAANAVALTVTGEGELEKAAAFFYPLPLAGHGLVWQDIAASDGRSKKVALFRGRTGKRVSAAPPPPPMPALALVREAAIPRLRRTRVASTARAKPASVIAGVPAGIAVIAVPDSPARRRELSDVTLRMMPRQARRARPRVARMAPTGRLIATANRLPAAGANGRDLAKGLQITPGHAVHVELSRDGAARGMLALEAGSKQVVRSIFLGGHGRPVADLLTTGPAQLAIPPGARRLVLIGEEAGTTFAGGAPMGLEADTRALALEGAAVAAHGCVVEVVSGLEIAPAPLTTITGHEFLRVARRVDVRFGRLDQGAVVVRVRATGASPAPVAQEVRWRAHRATLGAIRAVIRGESIALVIPVSAPGAWTLNVAVGRDYRLEGVVALGADPAALAAELATTADWNLLDDDWAPVRAASPSGGPAGIAAASAIKPIEGAARARVELLR